MRKYIWIVATVLLAMILSIAGCSDRSTVGPADPPSDLPGEWGATPSSTYFRNDATTPGESPQLLFQLRNPDAVLEMEMIVPREAFPVPTGNGQRVPLLVLLAPMDADEFYYRDRGLFELAAKMIESGEIKPMMILTIANDPTFGGYYYGNSYPAGFYDDIIADSSSRGLLGNISGLKWDDFLLDSPDKRGIGGIGQGAYGAFRHILKNPGMFGSISVADGPMSFSYLEPLFTDAIVEQQGRWAEKIADGKLEPDSIFSIQVFDTLVTMPISRMFVGGSLAFSPNDTALDYTLWDGGVRNRIEQPDTVTIEARYTWADTLDPSTSTTLVTALIPESEGGWGFHLPFGTDGSINSDIWDRWLENDLSQLLTDAPADALDLVSIWIGTSNQAKWNYDDATEDWVTTLTADGHAPDSVFRYTGYTGNPGTTGQYTYDLLKQMLKFHSDNFYPEPSPAPGE